MVTGCKDFHPHDLTEHARAHFSCSQSLGRLRDRHPVSARNNGVSGRANGAPARARALVGSSQPIPVPAAISAVLPLTYAHHLHSRPLRMQPTCAASVVQACAGAAKALPPANLLPGAKPTCRPLTSTAARAGTTAAAPRHARKECASATPPVSSAQSGLNSSVCEERARRALHATRKGTAL